MGRPFWLTAVNLLRHRFRRTQIKITPFISTNGILELPHFLAEFTNAATHRSVGGVNQPVVSAVVRAVHSSCPVAL